MIVSENNKEDHINTSENKENNKFVVDIITSNSLDKISIKFLILYLPIFWVSGLLVVIYWYDYLTNLFFADNSIEIVLNILLFPVIIFFTYLIFISGCAVLGKLILVIINLIHKPKEGIFRVDKKDKDYIFWHLRTELKKLMIWLMNNSPLPWIDTWAFRWFGVKINYSNSLLDAWCDVEFIKFGKKVIVGQGAIIMSSMIIGNYLLIEKVVIDDYSVIGGHSTISPGTVVGKNTVIGALGLSSYNQVLEDGWIYFGFPAIKLKKNKYAETRRDLIKKVDVDESKKFETSYEVNIDEDKKDLI